MALQPLESNQHIKQRIVNSPSKGLLHKVILLFQTVYFNLNKMYN